MPSSKPATPEIDEAPRAPKILLCDDSRDIVTILERVLAPLGYETLACYDGETALEQARLERPDLILLDGMLPGMDGLQVCRELKTDPETQRIMVLLVTGRGSIANRVEGFDAGADDYIPKPFNHPELVARVKSALRIKELNNDLEERNRQLLDSQAELVRTEKMATLGLLAAGVAHEFNNIIGGISGYAQLTRQQPDLLDEFIEVTLLQVERAQELTRSLATFNRSSEQDVQECSLRFTLEHSLRLVRKDYEERGLKLEQHLEDRDLQVTIQAGKLQEVVLNLLINAMHASSRGATISLTTRVDEEAQVVELVIADEGQGIPEENLQRIFDPFFTTKGILGGGNEEGTGLGLSVCHNIATAAGGDIRVTSRVGEGSAFTVILPIVGQLEAAT